MYGTRCRILLIAAMAGLLVACGAPKPAAMEQLSADLGALSEAISAATGYPQGAMELTGSRVRLRVSISDAKLSASDQPTREQVASAAVAAIEPLLGTHPALTAVQAISVSIIHADAAGAAAPSGWHVEDVLEFRKGPNQRFSLHST